MKIEIELEEVEGLRKQLHQKNQEVIELESKQMIK